MAFLTKKHLQNPLHGANFLLGIVGLFLHRKTLNWENRRLGGPTASPRISGNVSGREVQRLQGTHLLSPPHPHDSRTEPLSPSDTLATGY